MNEYIVTTDTDKINVSILNEREVTVNGVKYNYELIPSACQSYLLKLNDKVYEITGVNSSNDNYSVIVGGFLFNITVRTALQEKAIKLLEEAQSVSHHLNKVKAPMPGLILKVKKKENDIISQGDSVMILEAMKMENDLRAPSSGQIKEILVAEGAAVEKGTTLFTIE